MKNIIAVVLLLAPSFVPARHPRAINATIPPTRQVAITFDDLPFVRMPSVRDARLGTERLLRTITANRIPAIGFVNEGKLSPAGRLDPARVAILKMWVDAGLELGNHSLSHPDLNTTPIEAFKNQITQGEVTTRRLLASRRMSPRYFRHPFLHTGTSLETKTAIEQFLASHGYRVAPVTVDNSEWIFALAYDNAAAGNDAATMNEVARGYLSYMDSKFDYFERQSVAFVGREIKQVLLLHANALNADHFSGLFEVMKRRGYQMISLDEALTDKAYALPDTYIGGKGITWLHRWALSAGRHDKILPDDPKTPESILKLAGIASE
jgi:peptidoglycan/xylan/chitin deacetylase (PgdA/CDA1 family)